MRKILFLFGTFVALLLMSSCSDDVVSGVSVLEKEKTERAKSSLTVEVKNLQLSEDLFMALTGNNIFDESGVASGVSETDFISIQPVSSGEVVFGDITDYYKTNLYVNIFRKDAETYEVITHAGNQIEYFVLAGDVRKTIDCSIPAPEGIKKTLINVVLPQEYVGKEMYLVQKESLPSFLNILNSGRILEEGTYLFKTVPENTEVSFEITTPLSAKSYVLVILEPEEGLPYLSRELEEIDYSKTEVSFIFPKELKKKINISAGRIMEDSHIEPLNNHEVYLIESSRWPEVENVVKNLHGHPETGMYVDKTTVVNGKAVFEVYCTSGTSEYVVYIPKWNSEYYDSYQTQDVKVNSETAEYNLVFEYPYSPSTGGGGITKSVTIEVTIDALEGYQPFYSKAYVLNDSEKIREAFSAVQNWQSFEGLYSSAEIYEFPATVQFDEPIEINTDKEIAVFIYPIQKKGDFIFKIAIKRIPGANITNPCKITLTESDLESQPY